MTGANSGIGLETTRDLARRGARIIMACRRKEVAKQARQEVVDETGNQNIVVIELDISSVDSIRKFCEEVKQSEEKIDILIHNAGLLDFNSYTDDKKPKILATNLYGPFLLTHLLIDLVKRSKDGRIIFVSSLLGVLGNVDFKKLDSNGDFDDVPNSQYYNVSKYGLLVLAREFSERLKKDNIAVNALHPGLIITPIMDQLPLLKALWKCLRFLTKTVEEGAQTTIYLAVDDAGRLNTGKFFVDCHPFEAFTGPKHIANRTVLWQKCKQIMDLKIFDPKI